MVDLISCCVVLFLKEMVNLKIAPIFVQMEEINHTGSALAEGKRYELILLSPTDVAV